MTLLILLFLSLLAGVDGKRNRIHPILKARLKKILHSPFLDQIFKKFLRKHCKNKEKCLERMFALLGMNIATLVNKKTRGPRIG